MLKKIYYLIIPAFLITLNSMAQAPPATPSIMTCLTTPQPQGKAACIDAYITSISNSPSNATSAANILITMYQNNQSGGAGATSQGGFRSPAAGSGRMSVPGQATPQEAPPIVTPGQPQAPKAPAKPAEGINFY